MFLRLKLLLKNLSADGTESELAIVQYISASAQMRKARVQNPLSRKMGGSQFYDRTLANDSIEGARITN
jgi:hypothetical protein